MNKRKGVRVAIMRDKGKKRKGHVCAKESGGLEKEKAQSAE